MAGNPTLRPKLFHGAFVEYTTKKRRTDVRFQFNPEELSRNRSLSYEPPNKGRRSKRTLRDFHQREKNLFKLRRRQKVTIEEETLSFDLRLDATDKLSLTDEQIETQGVDPALGIAPELAALELLTLPQVWKKKKKKKGQKKPEEVRGISFSRKAKPPLVIFVWGRRKAVPVNINSLAIKETDFSFDLTPIRAVVSVQLTVIEGPNSLYVESFNASLSRPRAALSKLPLDEIEVPLLDAIG